MIRIFKLFSFTGFLSLSEFLPRAAGFIAFFAVLWGIERTGLLASTFDDDGNVITPGFADTYELLIFGAVLAFVPILALMTRRLADTMFPGWLVLAGPILLFFSSASAVMFDWPLGVTLFKWASYAAFAALAVGLLWPNSRVQTAA